MKNRINSVNFNYEFGDLKIISKKIEKEMDNKNKKESIFEEILKKKLSKKK